MENRCSSYVETFGRVDGENVIEEICTFEKEDNYSNRTIVAVVKFKTGRFGYGIQYVEDEVECDEYPKFKILDSSFDTEDFAIDEAEKYFNKNVR